MLDFKTFIHQILLEKYEYCYAEEKRSINDNMQHLNWFGSYFCLLDLRIAQKYPTLLPGFKENDYIETTFAIIVQFLIYCENLCWFEKHSICFLRQLLMIHSLLSIGLALKIPFFVRAIGFISIGNQFLLQEIIIQQYL